MSTIYIILVNFNSFKHTIECIESIKGSTHSSYKIVVIDNASKVQPKFDNTVHFIQLSDNKGFAAANNIGIQYALSQMDCSHIFLLNNDTVITPDTLNHLLEKSLKKPKALYGPKLLSYHNKNVYDHVGGVWDEKSCKFTLLLQNEPKSKRLKTNCPVDYICGAAIFAAKEVFLAIGPMDELYFLYFEEADWCFRGKKLGYNCQICFDATVYHKGGASQTSPSMTLSYYLWRNRFLFINKNFALMKKIRFYTLTLSWQCFKLFFQSALKSLLKKNDSRIKRLKRLRASRAGVKDALKGQFGPAKQIILN